MVGGKGHFLLGPQVLGEVTKSFQKLGVWGGRSLGQHCASWRPLPGGRMPGWAPQWTGRHGLAGSTGVEEFVPLRPSLHEGHGDFPGAWRRGPDGALALVLNTSPRLRVLVGSSPSILSSTCA